MVWNIGALFVHVKGRSPLEANDGESWGVVAGPVCNGFLELCTGLICDDEPSGTFGRVRVSISGSLGLFLHMCDE